MRGPVIPIVVSLAVLALALPAILLGRTPSGSQAGPALELSCAAAMKPVIETVVEAYRAETGVAVTVQYGGSGTLLSGLEIARRGDLFLAADNSYIELAKTSGIVAESYALARMRPVIAVAKGNLKNVRSVDDLLRDDIRLALASPEAASIGKVSERLFRASGRWEDVRSAVNARGVFKPTVNDVANDVKIGAVDAAVIWDAVAANYPELEAVPLEGSEGFVETVTVGLLTFGENRENARRFAEYLAAPDKGGAAFAAMGFTAAP